MRVTLAYPYDGHEPDETVDLPEDVARRLIADGVARPHQTPRQSTTPSGTRRAEKE